MPKNALKNNFIQYKYITTTCVVCSSSHDMDVKERCHLLQISGYFLYLT